MNHPNIRWTDAQIAEAGIDKRKLTRLLKLFDQCQPLLQDLKLTVYGNDGIGNLIHDSRPEHTNDGDPDFGAVVALVGFRYDGGGW